MGYQEIEHKISVFIPIFNEENIIERDIKAIEYIVKKIPFDYEIFIVNDASYDNTMAIAKKIELTNRKIRLLNFDIGPTRRENLACAFKEASGEIIVFVDIDLIASLRSLPNLIEQIILGYDIATGSRYLPDSKIKRKTFRLIISLLYNAFIRLIFNTDIHDHMCGFKAFKREAILALVEEMGYDKSLKRGVFWDTELLVRALRRGYKVKEIPIIWRERKKSALYFKREISAIDYIIEFYKKYKER